MGEFLKHLLSGQHQFASDGLLLMLVGGVGVYLRAIPERLWAWIVDQCTMQMTVKDEDAAFVWVKEWFLEQKFLTRMRRVDLDTTLRDEQPALVPAQGRHWFWHAGRPFVVYLYRTDEKKRYTERRTEWLTFVTLGRRQAFVKCHDRRIALVSSLYVREDDYWSRVQSYMPRMLDSVILRVGEKEHLVQDIERFKASKNRYRQLGVPYHRGYLLFGPPGTGKTSLVSALGAKFGMSVYVLNLTEFNDKTLMRATNDVPPNSIILFEDIDCMKSSNARPGLEEVVTARANNGTDGKTDNLPQNGRDAVWTAERSGRLSRTGRCLVCNDHECDRLRWTERCCVRGGSTIDCFSEERAKHRKSNCICDFFRRRTGNRPRNLLKHTPQQRPWRSFRGCCWDWRRESRIIATSRFY